MATRLQLRGDTATNWTAANPILAERELAIEIDTDLYKIGDGVTSWNSLPYKALRQIDEATVINFENQSVPTPPSGNTLNLFSRSLGGKMMLRQQGPSGLSTPLQPSIFQNNIVIINTNATTTIGVFGNTVTSVGTISHPVVTPAYGWMTNFASANSSGATCGTGNNGLLWSRSINIDDASGFFYYSRLAFPDSNYDETGASTGTRIFAGLTTSTMAQSVQLDNPTGNRIGFSRLHVNSSTTDTNWQITSRNGTSETRTDTGLQFLAEKVYDFYLFCAPGASEIGWRIDNLTDNLTEEGIVSTTLPSVNTIMRAGFQLNTVNAQVRNIRMQRVYIESDR